MFRCTTDSSDIENSNVTGGCGDRQRFVGQKRTNLKKNTVSCNALPGSVKAVKRGGNRPLRYCVRMSIAIEKDLLIWEIRNESARLSFHAGVTRLCEGWSSGRQSNGAGTDITRLLAW